MRRSVFYPIALMMAAATGHAAPVTVLARFHADFDGDGHGGTIELGSDGVVRIAEPPRGEVKVAGAITHGALTTGRYRGQNYVVAQITPVGAAGAAAAPAAPAGTGGQPPPGSEAVILRADDGLWHEVARFAVGGVGLDHDYGVEVAASDDGIYRFQTRSDLRRCDGRPAYLFAEKFDGTRFRRASALPSQVPDTAFPLAARRDPAPAAAPLLYHAHTASLQIGAGDAGGLVIPRELDDGRLDTVWREELAASTGEGQFFTFEPRAAGARAAQLRIVAGNPASSATIRRFNRPRRIAVVTGAEAGYQAFRIELPDAAGEPLGTAFVIDLPGPVAGCVTVVLESTYGPPQGTTAIAELEVFADGERAGSGEALLARVVAQGAGGATAAAAALRTRGPAAVAAIEGELAASRDPAVRRRLIGALVGVSDPAAAPVLGQAATAGWVRDQDLLDVVGALGALGQVQVVHDLAADSRLPVAVRVAAVMQLPPTGAGFARLLDLAEGLARSRGAAQELRRAVTERLSAAPVPALIAAAQAASTPAVIAELWRAMVRSARAAPSGRPAALAVLMAALPGETDYEQRYRLVEGIAALGDAAALGALADWLARLTADAAAAALRQVALRQVAASPRPEALRLVTDGVRDSDPGVRMAALAALAGDPDSVAAWQPAEPEAIDRMIGDALARDRWPEVRRHAANAHAARCQRPGPARALAGAVDRDPDLGVRGDAVGALVRCRAPGTAALLARLWNDPRAPLELRTRAVLEAAGLGDPALAAALVDAFGRWRGELMSSAAALALAQTAAASLGQLAPPGAARALTEALDDTSFPELVQAAALALGALGPACPPEAKARLAALARDVEQVAVAARRGAAQCGRR